METKNIFQPNKHKVLLGLVFYLIIGAGTWVSILSRVLEVGFALMSNVKLPILEILFSLIAGYTLSCFFVTYFKKDQLKDLPLVVKVLAVYLFYQLLRALFLILTNIKPNFNSSFVPVARYMFGGNYALSIALLIASLLFLIIKVDKNYLLASIYFVFQLINPYDAAGQLLFSPLQEGSLYGYLLNVVFLLTQGDMKNAFVGLLGALFPISIIAYLYLKNQNKTKSEYTMLIIIVVSYLVSRFGYLLFR